METVCKYNQRGYCKYGELCRHQHVDIICDDELSCSESTCRLRHRNQCRNFSQHGKCRFIICAYAHRDNTSDTKVKLLEQEVEKLKKQIAIQNNKMSEIMIKLLNFEASFDNEDRNHCKQNTTQHGSNFQSLFKCDQCDYECTKKVILNKHVNTKHPVDIVNQASDSTVSNTECSLCEDKFNTSKEITLENT